MNKQFTNIDKTSLTQKKNGMAYGTKIVDGEEKRGTAEHSAKDANDDINIDKIHECLESLNDDAFSKMENIGNKITQAIDLANEAVVVKNGGSQIKVENDSIIEIVEKAYKKVADECNKAARDTEKSFNKKQEEYNNAAQAAAEQSLIDSGYTISQRHSEDGFATI